MIGLLGKLRPEPQRKVYDGEARRKLLAKLNMNYNKILDKEERDEQREKEKEAEAAELPASA